MVSVPSRGLCFQSIRGTWITVDACTRFRPLSGIMFSIYPALKHTNGTHIVFPSPLGDYVFNRSSYTLMAKSPVVSVPSRGLCFQSICRP